MIREKLKKNHILKIIFIIWNIFKNKNGIFKRVFLLNNFFLDYLKFKNIKNNQKFSIKFSDLYPRIYDKTENTPVDPVYFYQDTWCARKIFDNKPKHHYDVGSSNEFIGIISQFTPTTMVDIRPLPVSLTNLSFKKGSILNLPFSDSSIKSLSSICVIEHIGLGRYGDPLDQFGSEKAVKELIRVLSPDGDLYISIPINNDNIVYFNAHKSFTRKYVLDLFSSLKLAEEKYVYGNNIFDLYDASKGFGTGLYHFKK